MPARLREKHDGELADHFSVRLWLRLLSCSTVIEKRLRRGLADRHGTTLPRFDVMAALDRAPQGLMMSELSAKLLVSNGNVTGLVQSLKAEGFVELTPAPSDRRASIVRLTPKGRTHFAELAAAHHAWVDAMLASLTLPEREALYALLGRVKASLADNPGPDKEQP